MRSEQPPVQITLYVTLEVIQYPTASQTLDKPSLSVVLQLDSFWIFKMLKRVKRLVRSLKRVKLLNIVVSTSLYCPVKDVDHLL